MTAMAAVISDPGRAGITAMLSGAKPVQPLLSARVPVFRGNTLVGFVNRGDSYEASRAGEWTAQDVVEISIEDGVAHLSGQVDDIHDVLALRGIAAATPGVTAIDDDLWVSCE